MPVRRALGISGLGGGAGRLRSGPLLAMSIVVGLSCLLLACGDDETSDTQVWTCAFEGGATSGDAPDAPDSLDTLGCQADFDVLASEPADTTLSQARTVKTIVDREFEGRLYFQNSVRFPIHHDFASARLSVADGLFPVDSLQVFNQEQYTLADRRFLLGSVTYYAGTDTWAYEVAPYDRLSGEMLAQAFNAVREQAFFGSALRFHPTSETQKSLLEELPDDIPTVSTEMLYGDSDYQPLNAAESYGRLRFLTADQLETEFVAFRDIVVLDRVPNDISVTMGIITSEFQTPLAHINVLSQNRGTPNMALRGAFDSEDLRSLEGQWVRLSVEGNGYKVEPVTMAEADTWWDDNRPATVQVPGADLSVLDLRDIESVVDYGDDDSGEAKLAAIKEGTRAFGGKAANFSALARVNDITVPEAFAVPIAYYAQFMSENGFDARVEALLADAGFRDDPAAREAALHELREDMKQAPVNAEFEAMLLDKIAGKYPVGLRLRFRSSTNAEDLDGFTGAGLYTSKSGDPNDPDYPVLDAIRKVWASVWFFRAFEERSYRSIDHLAVGMALLVHRSFPEEEANGVALTNNPFDRSGLEPAFYVNVQYGDHSVVLPSPGVTTDQFLWYYGQATRPTMYLSNSSLGSEGQTVMTRSQVNELGEALLAVRNYFSPIYGAPGWWAMDVEFKLDGEPGEEPTLYLKQARPFGDR